jgi:proline-specific peptidase
MPLREGFVESEDGLRLRYELEGPDQSDQSAAAATPLLCAAGGPGRASEYLGDLGGLTATRPVVRLDTRGTGRSEAPDDPSGYGVDRLVEDLERVRIALGVEQVDLMGHSAGGPAALAYAAAHPERVRRLLLVTTYLAPPPDVEEERQALREARSDEPWYLDAVDAAEGMRYARAAEQQRLSRLQRPFYYGVWNERTQEHAASADRQMSPRAEAGISAGWRALAARSSELMSIEVPTLVLAGGWDVITPPSGGRQLAESLPNAQFAVLEHVGHFPWVDAPERFTRAVNAFLGQST